MQTSSNHQIDGISVEHLHQNRMCIVTITQFTHAHIDAWVAAVEHYWTLIPESKQRFLVYDVSQVKNLTMTRYLRQRSRELAEAERGTAGRVAIALDVSPIIRRVIQAFIQLTSRRHQPDIDIQLFETREESITWVEEGLFANKSSSASS